jgi:iron complex outermembrane receptor protein
LRFNRFPFAFATPVPALVAAFCLALAGNAEAASKDAIDGPEVIVMTAENRTTNLQDTPISASVLLPDDLSNREVTSLEQLTYAAPAVTFADFGQGGELNIRGIGKGENNVQTPSGVATYVNGVAFPGGFFRDFPLYDLESVEVLRGPQAFGSENAIGGALFVNTVKPNFDSIGGYVEAQAGNYYDGAVQGAVNVPITDDLAVRASAIGERRNSFWSITGTHTGNLGSLHQAGARLETLWQPVQAFEAYFYAETLYVDRGGFPADPATLGCTAAPHPSCTPNTSDPFKIGNDGYNRSIEYDTRAVLGLSYTFENGIALRSTSGYEWSDVSEQYDLDGTDNPVYRGFFFYDRAQDINVSEELSLVSPAGQRFGWVLGTYLQHEHFEMPPLGGFNLATPAGYSDVLLVYHAPKQDEALFGQVSYDVTQALQVQFDLRYNESTSRLRDVESHAMFWVPTPVFAAPCPAALAPGEACNSQTHESDSALTGKFNIGYTLDDNNYLYGFVATGHKDGALNTTPDFGGPDNPPALIKPEKVTDYEAGWKTSLFDRHLRTQLDAFYSDYRDYQSTVQTGPGQMGVVNVPTATVYGFEAQGEAALDVVSLDFGGAYIHGAYGAANFQDPRFLDIENIKGHQMVYSPHLSLHVGAQHVFAFENGETLTPRVEYAHVDSQTTSVFNVPGLDQLGARNIVNAQLTLRMRDSWSFTAYATNLTNDRYIAGYSAGLGVAPGTSPNLRNAGAPQQFGIRIVKSF